MINEQRSGVTVGNRRGTAFYVAAVAALGLFEVVPRDLLPLVVTARYVDVGPHRLHDLNFLALVWLALLGLVSQLHRPDERVTAAILPVLLGALAAVRGSDRRFAAWSAGALAVYLGASSAAFPGLASSAGPFWGGLGVAWGVVFVGAVEATRRADRAETRGG